MQRDRYSEPLTDRVGLVPGQQLPLQRCNRRLDLLDLICQHLQHTCRAASGRRVSPSSRTMANQLADIAHSR
jgi:hypothetical protein